MADEMPRADEVTKLLAAPARWRIKMEDDRLARAREVRSLINDKYRTVDMAELKIRTLASLIDVLTGGQVQASRNASPGA